MTLGILVIHLKISGCKSLKEKRAHIKPYITRIHNQFNVTIAEIGRNDDWDQSIIAIANLSNNVRFTNRLLDKIVDYTENNFKDLEILDQKLEFL